MGSSAERSLATAPHPAPHVWPNLKRVGEGSGPIAIQRQAHAEKVIRQWQRQLPSQHQAVCQTLTERGGIEGAQPAQRGFVQGLSVPQGCLWRREFTRTAWFQGEGWMKPYILLCRGVERLLLGEMSCPASWHRFSEKPQPLSSSGLLGSFGTSFLITLLSHHLPSRLKLMWAFRGFHTPAPFLLPQDIRRLGLQFAAIVTVQSLSHVQLSATPWTAVREGKLKELLGWKHH